MILINKFGKTIKEIAFEDEPNHFYTTFNITPIDSIFRIGGFFSKNENRNFINGVSIIDLNSFDGDRINDRNINFDSTFYAVGTSGRISVSASGIDLATHGSPGTYQSVTVDAYGRVSSGSNPTTLSGYGITDAASASALQSHSSDTSLHLSSTQNTLLDGIAVTSEKINYLTDVSSNIQSQLDNKSDSNHTHAVATTSSDGFLSSSDKSKLDEIESGAEVNVNADWNASSGDAQILNKPTTLSGYGITDAAMSTDLSTHVNDSNIHLTSTQNILLDGITVTSEKINYLADVSSNIQDQLDAIQSNSVNDANNIIGLSIFL
jgi:phage-related tail fiber protein